MGIRRILVPVDISGGSRAALAYAISLARALGSSVEALTVWQPTSELSRSDTLNALREMLARSDRLCLGPITARVESGDPAQVITRLAEDRECDLIVMGTHGGRHAAAAVLGSVAECVVRRSTAPVVTVRDDLAEPARLCVGAR